jgi:glucose-1-phosphate adenylyltransferase
MQDVVCFILGGGRGASLYPLTKFRSTPAVQVAGMYRLIDVPISNCINSEVKRIYILTQFLAVSLHRHITTTYKFAPFSRGFVEVLAAQQTNEAADWYQGTADALRQNLRYLIADRARDVLILSADGLYRMNFAEMVQTHRERNADVTIAVAPVRQEQASSLGIVRLDDQDHIVELVEKPHTPEQIEAVRAPRATLEKRGLARAGKEFLANMGVYLVKRQVLLDLLQGQPEAVDLVTQHFARILTSRHVRAHLFLDYWQDVGSIRTFFDAHLALAGAEPPFDFHIPEGVIYTHMRNLPASQVRASRLEACLISDGCLIQAGAQLERCVIGLRTQLGRDVILRETVVAGTDRYETPAQREANRAAGLPDYGIGDGTVIQQAILDKDCRIGRNVRILNERGVREADTENYVIRDGIVVVPKGAVLPDGTVI